MGEAFQPEEFGSYRLTHLLGKGGMASVFRALREGPHGFSKQVAIKRLHSALNANEAILKALINEARLGGQLKHPNIVEVYEFNKVRKDGTDAYYLAMEFVDGWTLDRVLKLAKDFEEPPPAEVVLDVVIQVCGGLHYAHMLETLEGDEVRVVHRDIKPANIILSRDGIAKIMDFGIAKAATNLYKTTLADTTKGTPHYMSPEQVAGDPNIAATSDLFALGSVLYELITGKLLFRGDSLVSVLFAVAKAQVDEQMAELDGHMPGLGAVVGRCLSKNPAQRYQSAEALGNDLQALRTSAGGCATIQSYLYALRNHMIARDRQLQEEATVVEGGPQFATLLGPDWNEIEEEQARADREMDAARKAADEVIEEVASLRAEPEDEEASSWLETLPAEDALGSGTVPAAIPISPRQDQHVSMPGTARPDAVTAVDLKHRDVDTTRDFPPVPEAKNRLLMVVALLVVLGGSGITGILLIGRGGPGPAATPVTPSPASEPIAAGADQIDLSFQAASPTPRAGPSPRPTGATVAAATPRPSPVAVASAAPAETPPPSATPASQATDLVPAPPPAAETPTQAWTPPPPVAASRGKATLKVKGLGPSLMVYVDGEFASNTPVPSMELPAGRHTIQLKDPTSGEFSPTRTVTLEPGKATLVPYYDFVTRTWK